MREEDVGTLSSQGHSMIRRWGKWTIFCCVCGKKVQLILEDKIIWLEERSEQFFVKVSF